MTSIKQINANRQNGKLWGVKTQQGKDIIRTNALRHWITSNLLIDPQEQAILDQIEETLIEEYQPIGSMEHFLVHRIALSMFRLQRCSRLEDHYFFTANEEHQKWQITGRVLSESELCE